MAKKRSIKVISQSGYKYRETPTIMLKGQWLKEVIEFTVLENLHGADKDKLDLCLKYMGNETKKAFETIG